jgi:ATP-binding protein involved in chromosome partitioning
MHLVALHALEPHPDIGLDVFHHVANVKVAIGVGQGCRDEEASFTHFEGARPVVFLGQKWLEKRMKPAYSLLEHGKPLILQGHAASGFRYAIGCQGEYTRMALTAESVKETLKKLTDPNTGKDYVAGKSVKNIIVDGNDVSLDVELGYPAKSQIDPIRKSVIKALKDAGAANVSANVYSKIISHAVQRGVKLLPNVKNIIAVASGKGGVGKSTTAVNLALALAAEGATVGMLDADIYGPSQPMMLGITGRPESRDGKSLEPMEGHGIQASSIGFMIDTDTPMVWRGPMVTQALEQMLRDTNWRDLDYLIVDMPPGTGDIQLTLSQKVPVTGSVIVTTPQDIALLDARKGLKMFEKVGIPILGIVENMAVHICSNCGHSEHIFGSGGGERMAKEYDVEYLGGLPLDIKIREQADSGMPTVVADPDGPIAAIYKQIARRIAVKVAEKAKDMTSMFPTITVSKDT